LSRSAFAERFNAYVGSPPIEYLARWRMQLAAKHLDEGIDIAEAAHKVGYASPAAFNRVFKRFAGTTPAAWRRAKRNKTTVPPFETTSPLIASSNPATRQRRSRIASTLNPSKADEVDLRGHCGDRSRNFGDCSRCNG
jgi:AraC-like DNA-binding protein